MPEVKRKLVTVGIVGSRRRDTNSDNNAVWILCQSLVNEFGKDGFRLVSGGCPKGAEDSDILYALVADDRIGGTEDTVKKALKLGKPVYLVLIDGEVEQCQV